MPATPVISEDKTDDNNSNLAQNDTCLDNINIDNIIFSVNHSSTLVCNLSSVKNIFIGILLNCKIENRT